MNRISIMQPYLLPYAGYFRLLVDVDAFVVGDVQQFSRGSWVNRNRLREDSGQLGWLTLPLKHQPLGTRIHELAFADEADLLMRRSMQRFEACRRPTDATHALVERLGQCEGAAPVALIIELLRRTADLLGLRVPMLRQSELGLPADLRGAEHVHAVCAALGATEYVNAPGGRALYDASELLRQGVRLQFLQPYQGNAASVLQRLHDSDPATVRREIIANTRYDNA